MDNGVYISLSRQLALFRDMEITANNIANANTTGYNSEHILFSSYLAKDNNQGVRNNNSYAHDVASYRNLKNGPMQTTDNPLDVAIKGQGYFMVDTPLGVRYTRAGNFQIGHDGSLVTTDGYPVLNPSEQPIIFPPDTRSVEIGSAGNIKVNGNDFSAIGVVQFDNEQLLERAGNTLYKADITPQPAEDFVVAQGVIENANVQPVMEMTHMITVSRAVADAAKLVATMYDLQRKTSSTWAQQG